MIPHSELPIFSRIASAAENFKDRMKAFENYEFSINSQENDYRNIQYLLSAIEKDLDHLRKSIEALDVARNNVLTVNTSDDSDMCGRGYDLTRSVTYG